MTRSKLAPNQIGKHGQIQEWLIDYEEVEQHHRHVHRAVIQLQRLVRAVIELHETNASLDQPPRKKTGLSERMPSVFLTT